ncbi:MAG TPA: hypothetical protein VJ111_07315 [Chitinophagaceae bacterium]|nr:hypothetical protein [Chitinophagaceae bacterium]
MSSAYNIKTDRLRILVLGYIVRGPMGGMTWHHLQYFLGLFKMGHDVYFLEDSGDTDYACYDPLRNITDTNPEYGLHYASQVFKRVGLGNRWGYYDHHKKQWHGPISNKAKEIIRDADLLLNLSCSNTIRSWLTEVPVRILVDTDPLFTQIRNLTDPERFKLSKQHNVFFTFGENINHPTCQIPDDGFPWQPTRQPIVLDAWPVSPGRQENSFTTVMKWESYPGQHFNGSYFGLKADSFAGYWDLPRKTSEQLEMAISDKTAPRGSLSDNGWHISNPFHISANPWKYQEYIQQSKAEFSIAKHGYVVGNTGWFSERSAGYLASGRPVVVQHTGFSDWLKTDFGLIPFNDANEALSAIEEINNNYVRHCQNARELAEAYFSSDKVLTELIERSIQ